MSAAIATIAETTKPPPRKRWIPLSLRMFATILGMLAVIGGWQSVRLYWQQAAVREIERLGIEISVKPPGPEWLRAWGGWEKMKLFGTVRAISVGGWRGPDNEVLRVNFTDEDMRRLQDLHELEVLCLHGSRITDDGLRYVTHLSKLNLLNLEGTDVTDVGLTHLRAMTSLKVLFLRDSRVSDHGAAELKRALPDLEIAR